MFGTRYTPYMNTIITSGSANDTKCVCFLLSKIDRIDAAADARQSTLHKLDIFYDVTTV